MKFDSQAKFVQNLVYRDSTNLRKGKLFEQGAVPLFKI